MSVEAMIATGLPLNRKERYYTGTVLPLIICADDFAPFHRLTDLIDGYTKPPIKRIDVITFYEVEIRKSP
jgi:hypothetical protein